MAQVEITCAATITDINQALNALGEKSELYLAMTTALVSAVNSVTTEVCVTITDDSVVMSLSNLDGYTSNRVKSINVEQVSVIDLGNGDIALATSKLVATQTNAKPAGWPYNAGDVLKKAMPEKKWEFPNPISQTPSNSPNASKSVMDYVTTENVLIAAVVAGLGYAAYSFFGSKDE